MILAGNINENVNSDFLIRIQSQIEKLCKFSQVLLLSNAFKKHNVNSELSNVKIVKTSERTSGALATVGFGLPYVNEREPFLIIPSNAEITGNNIENFSQTMLRKNSVVGAIVFRGTDPKYSYARLGKSGEIIEIVEKKVSGSCALAGVYYFSNKKSFLSCLEWAMVNNIQNEGKFFISPALNYFLAQSIEISLFEISEKDYLRY